MTTQSRSSFSRVHLGVFALLALLMALTRYHHFGSALHLPDASLAVFFAAGFYLSQRWPLALLLGEAALIDYLAITVGGTSSWCVSAAYPFLIPTYAAMWFGGRWYATRHTLTWSSVLPLAVALAVSGSIAFVISNGAFYLLSGKFPELSWVQYGERIARYYWPYLSNAFVYIAFIVFVHLVICTAGRSIGMRGWSGR